ncbi:MAG: DNA double-strand break repair nuclease NurA [Bacteroidales bacterium]
MDIVGIDGSQIYHDPTLNVIWSYVQVVAYQKNFPPRLSSRFFDEVSLTPKGSLVSLGVVDLRRNLLEIEVARREYLEGRLSLVDGGLLPFADSITREDANGLIDEFVANVQSSALIAGVISGPRSHLLMMDLISLYHNEKPGTRVAGDAFIMRGLKTGERSAVFLHATPRNELFLQAGVGICFFFVRINEKEFVRIELPQTLAEDPDKINLIHAAILEDSRITGYSYVLSNAHMQVAISLETAQAFRDKAEIEYISQVQGRMLGGSSKRDFKAA